MKQFSIDYAGFTPNTKEVTEYLQGINQNALQVGDVLFYAGSNSTDFFDFEVVATNIDTIFLVAVPEEKHAYDLA